MNQKLKIILLLVIVGLAIMSFIISLEIRHTRRTMLLDENYAKAKKKIAILTVMAMMTFMFMVIISLYLLTLRLAN